MKKISAKCAKRSASCLQQLSGPLLLPLRSPRDAPVTQDHAGFDNPQMSPPERPTNKFPPVLVARATPPKQPRTIRALKPRGAVRAGVLGSLSAISSTRADSVRTTRVAGRPRNASLVPAKCNQPRWVAQQTTAGAVSERSPVKQPRRKQRRSNVMTGNAPFVGRESLTYQKSFQPLPSVS